jgi:hypothetical protein
LTFDQISIPDAAQVMFNILTKYHCGRNPCKPCTANRGIMQVRACVITKLTNSQLQSVRRGWDDGDDGNRRLHDDIAGYNKCINGMMVDPDGLDNARFALIFARTLFFATSRRPVR